MPGSFEARGFAVVPGVLAESECQSALDAVLEQGQAESRSRAWLTHPWCQKLALSLKQHAALTAGSHRFGRLDVRQAAALREEHGEVTAGVKRGDVLAMRPLLLHASSKALVPSFRRVLHFVFGPPVLPRGLRWATAV